MEAGQTAQRNKVKPVIDIPLSSASMEAGQTAQRNHFVADAAPPLIAASMEAGQTAQRNVLDDAAVKFRGTGFNGGRANRPA